MTLKRENLWIRENTLISDDVRAMHRCGESPVRVLETNMDFPLSLNGDVNRGSNGKGHPPHHPHHHHDTHHDPHDAPAPQPTDTMLKHKFPSHEDLESVTPRPGGRPGHLANLATKHGLTKKGLTLLLLSLTLCGVLVVVLLSMAAMWPTSEYLAKMDICLTPDCLRASAQLQGSLHMEAAPCDDFWTYSCGGWLEDNPLPPTRSKWSVKQKLHHQALAEMRELLDTMDEPQDVNSIEWKLKTFYWSCMNVHSYMKSGLDLIKRKIITELYGWNLMRDTWDRRRWEFDVVLTKLHAEFGVSPFFKVTVVPDPRREARNIIKLVPSGYALPHRSYYDRMPNNPVEQAYKQYIKDTVKLFDASGPDALEFAAHLFHYEGRIAEITPKEDAMRDPLASNTAISIGELSQIARSVPWLDLLRHLFPKSHLDHTSEVLIVSKEYFIDLSQLISTTDRSLLNNYLIFNFVSAFMPYMSTENKKVWDLYHMEFTGLKEPEERWEFCMETTSKFFGYALGSLYERSPRRYKARRRNEQVVDRIFNQIRYTIMNRVRDSYWYPEGVKNQLITKLHNMTVAAGYPDRLLDVNVINTYYKNYAIFIKDFFQNLQDSIHNAQRQLEQRLLTPVAEAGWMAGLLADGVVYVHEANKVVIPPHLLNPPLFHRNYPMAMVYGGLGVRVAREVLRGLGVSGLPWTHAGKLVPHTKHTNRTLQLLMGEAACVGAATKDLSVDKEAVVDNTALDTAAEVRAARHAYQAFMYLAEDEPQPRYPSFETFNSTNIFFMAYAGSLCGSYTSQQEDFERTCGDSLMNKARLRATLPLLPEFSEAFACPAGSRHYPRHQCPR